MTVRIPGKKWFQLGKTRTEMPTVKPEKKIKKQKDNQKITKSTPE